MLNCGSQAACSTNWNSAELESKLAQIMSAKTRSMSEVQSAIQRALRATSSASPRRIMIAATPTSGRKVTRVRSGQFCIASPDLEQEIPGEERHHADQHREGIVVEVTRLEAARQDRETTRRLGKTIGAEPVDYRAIALLPEAAPERESGAHEDEIVKLVEVPLVEEEEIKRPEGARAPGGNARLPDIADPSESDAEKPGAERQLADPERHVLRAFERVVAREDDDRIPPELLVPRADEIIVTEEAGDDRAQGQHDQGPDHHRRRFMGVMHHLVIGAWLAVEGHEQQAPGIERGEEGDDDAEPIGVMPNPAARGPGR